ncbi:MAG: ankyrin repeat domain-containing protein [Pseudomonadota bacterium]|jgi:ankyrin repeat protein
MSTTHERWYSLRDVICAKDLDHATSLLAQEPSLLHLTNSIGETVLHFLAVENVAEGVAWLHARGAELDVKNKFGTPALFEVASLGYIELFTWFLKHGANVHARDADEQDIVQHLLEQGNAAMAEWVRENGLQSGSPPAR